jgi:hypothetical protein
MRQDLQLAVFQNLEIISREIGHVMPFGIGHHGIHLHESRRHAKHDTRAFRGKLLSKSEDGRKDNR